MIATTYDPGIVLDYAADGAVVAIEVLHVRDRTRQAVPAAVAFTRHTYVATFPIPVHMERAPRPFRSCFLCRAGGE
jgi:hypothetical protein